MSKNIDGTGHVTLDEARAAKVIVVERYHTMDNIVGLGITRINDDYAVKVNLSRPMRGAELPTHIGRVPVRIEVTGIIRPSA